MTPKRSPHRRFRLRRAVVLVGTVAVATAGVVVADTLTRPLDVHLRTWIEIYREEDGAWKKVDEVGPENVRFEASLLEMARGEGIGTDYVLRATSKAGEPYSVRLARDADVDFDPASGRFEADVEFEVTYAGRRAIVRARPSTETRFGPAGATRGRRADGVLGRGPTTFTLVSVNEAAFEDGSPMMLVTREEYRMIPRGREGR